MKRKNPIDFDHVGNRSDTYGGLSVVFGISDRYTIIFKP